MVFITLIVTFIFKTLDEDDDEEIKIANTSIQHDEEFYVADPVLSLGMYTFERSIRGHCLGEGLVLKFPFMRYSLCR